jgi:hypothetical protein
LTLGHEGFVVLVSRWTLIPFEWTFALRLVLDLGLGGDTLG